ncbi:acyltransferase [Chitiniphilus purpureus]|uniref:Acyltransferase n=1 Tax=Chitiniphilus purpureus TaxID=2981137 RepID=A0ABY6DNE8_9NEIS|nr:acyltransferase [Chitiniphilus sp. CD1]UXY15542.1 acyltransferase [Chitiniphilus sp. CD1]
MEHRDNNLNLLRLIAAFFVLYEHSFALTGRPNPTNFLGSGFGSIGVAIFFVISGYLISCSWLSGGSVRGFLWRRALRIIPGLVAITLISIGVFGPLLTTLPLNDFFSSAGTWFYLWNIALFPVFAMPGVLEAAPVANAMNGSLWTLPLEVALYATAMLLGLSKGLKKQNYLLFIFLFLILFFVAKNSAKPIVYYGTDWRLFIVYGIYFYSGTLFKIFEFNRGTISGLGCSVLIVSILGTNIAFIFDLLKILAFTYIVLSVGLASSKIGSWVNERGDYSYGFYIYAFPVQQIVFAKLPWLGMGVYIAVCAAITMAFAWGSWHFIESKALSFKNLVS